MTISRITVSCPSDLNGPGTALAFVGHLHAAANAQTVELDFRPLRFARPYATLLIAQAIREIVSRRAGIGLDTTVRRDGLMVGERQNAVLYLAHIGFFEYVGIKYGNPPGGAFGSATYLPITQLRRSDLEAKDPGKPIQEAVNRRCRSLAEMLTSEESEQDLLMYCFREIVRNVFEHADTGRCTLMAQKYGGDLVEVAIADEGIGVPASLGKTHSFATTEDALRAALRPGITSVTGAQRGDKWDNTGYGLYVASELGRAAGSFSIASGGTLLNVSTFGEMSMPAPLRGTAVRLTVSTADSEFFSNRLKKIVDEGEQLARLDPDAIRPASLSTRLALWE